MYNSWIIAQKAVFCYDIDMNNEELIQKAKSVAITKQIAEETAVGEVGAALITDKGNVYTGASIHAPSGLGFCGEASAIAAMITNGENRIKTIVATDGQGKNVRMLFCWQITHC